MLSEAEFVRKSLELNLFFLRIMKEHALFLKAGFVPKNSDLAAEAEAFKNEFNVLLIKAVTLGDGQVSTGVLNSSQIVTDKTIVAEQKTELLSGIAIDMVLTEQEMMLMPGEPDPFLSPEVEEMNGAAVELTNRLIEFKTRILEGVLNCTLYTHNFPSMLEHIRHEAEHYVEHLRRLQNRRDSDPAQDLLEHKVFWDDIMGEHGELISHLLDPTEKELIKTAERFADRFSTLENRAQALERNSRRGKLMMNQLIYDELRATKAIKEFKTTAEEGLLSCQIRSLIVPLLADHVLREANHFLYTLEQANPRGIR